MTCGGASGDGCRFGGQVRGCKARWHTRCRRTQTCDAAPVPLLTSSVALLALLSPARASLPPPPIIRRRKSMAFGLAAPARAAHAPRLPAGLPQDGRRGSSSPRAAPGWCSAVSVGVPHGGPWADSRRIFGHKCLVGVTSVPLDTRQGAGGGHSAAKCSRASAGGGLGDEARPRYNTLKYKRPPEQRRRVHARGTRAGTNN